MNDLVITGGRVASVFTGEVFAADVGITDGRITEVSPPGAVTPGGDRIDASDCVVVPGFIDAHMHVESAFLTPAPFAWLTAARGTTTVLADPHEIANVAGEEAVRWMVAEGRRTRQTMLFGIPSCVPSLPGLEAAGAELGPDSVDRLAELPEVVALGEVMDYRAVAAGEGRVMSMVAAARRLGLIIDGHCPGLSGSELARYLAAGIDSDHTKNSTPVALEKARMGMVLMLQEKCLLPDLVEALGAFPLAAPVCLVTDDIAIDAIGEHGHLDHIGRVAIGAGMEPMTALRALTLEPARRLRLADRGAVAPGLRADLVLVDDLRTLRPRVAVAGGAVVGRDGRPVEPEPAVGPHGFGDSVRLAPPGEDDFAWPASGPDGPLRLRAMRVNAVDTSTREEVVEAAVRDGRVELPEGSLRLAVFNRYGLTADRAMAPVIGMAVADGAVATTYAHDSHNLLVLGTSPSSMAAAADAVVRAHGGMAVARAGRVVASLPLAVGGVMSDRPVDEVARGAAEVRRALEDWGYRHANPLMSLSTLALPVSPALKLTDRGLVDVVARELVSATL